jgi:hypothetical protein
VDGWDINYPELFTVFLNCTSNQAIIIPFHILSNPFFTNYPSEEFRFLGWIPCGSYKN